MAVYTETQKKILEVGKREFLANGFKNASLRGIVKEAGFTQGAFYGYYPDKVSLFYALVSEAADGLAELLQTNQQAFLALLSTGRTAEAGTLADEFLPRMVQYIYDHFDAFKLLICCAEGTKYQNYIHDLVNLETQGSDRCEDASGELQRLRTTLSPMLRHMITSAYFTALFEAVAHDQPRRDALRDITALSRFFRSGWQTLLTP